MYHVVSLVVKLRGNAGERRSWDPKKLPASVPRPHTAESLGLPLVGTRTTAVCLPLQLTVGPIIFSELLGPKFML